MYNSLYTICHNHNFEHYMDLQTSTRSEHPITFAIAIKYDFKTVRHFF